MNEIPSGTLRLVTSNKDKLREAQHILGRPLVGISLPLEEPQSTQLEYVVRHKAVQAYRLLGLPAIVEDTALVFDGWGVLPGPFIRFFLEGLGPAGLVKALEPFGNWGAEAQSGVGFHDGWRCHYFPGRVKGTIVAPRGGGGFGWDPIFQPEGSHQTYAEMAPETKNAHSMRALALKKLADHLRSPAGPGGSFRG